MNKLLSILNAQWLIHESVVVEYLPLFLAFVNGQQLNFSESQHKFAFYAQNDNQNFDNYESLDNSILTENVIAIINVNGPLMSWQTAEISKQLKLAELNEKVISIILQINSPGGMVFYTDLFADQILKCKKPIVAYVMNLCCSAAYWIASACDFIYCSSELDQLGSIGVKSSFTDWNNFLKTKLNVSIYDIYASKSIDKDIEIKELLAGNDQVIKDKLDFINEKFHNSISVNRNISLDSEVFTGKTYYSQKAISLKLADEIISFDDLLLKAYDLGIKQNLKNILI